MENENSLCLENHQEKAPDRKFILSAFNSIRSSMLAFLMALSVEPAMAHASNDIEAINHPQGHSRSILGKVWKNPENPSIKELALRAIAACLLYLAVKKIIISGGNYREERGRLKSGEVNDVARHEVGHAVVLLSLFGLKSVKKISLKIDVERGHRGAVYPNNKDPENRYEYVCTIAVLLAGVIALPEKVAGGFGDLKNAKSVALTGVRDLAFRHENSELQPFLTFLPEEKISEELMQKIELEIACMYKEAEELGRKALKENKELVEYLVPIILKKKELKHKAFRSLIEEFESRGNKIYYHESIE